MAGRSSLLGITITAPHPQARHAARSGNGGPLLGPGDRAGQSDVLPRHSALPQWNGNGFVSGLGTMSLNRIIFDGHGGAKSAERWSVGKRIRDVEEAPDGSLWMVEHAAEGALIHVTPKEVSSR